MEGNAHLRVPDQLHRPALVRRETCDFPHDASNSCDTLAGLSLAVGGLGFQHTALGHMAAVDTPGKACRGLRSETLRSEGSAHGSLLTGPFNALLVGWVRAVSHHLDVCVGAFLTSRCLVVVQEDRKI